MSSDSHDSLVIAIQARTGSTRLPGKMTREFFQGKTILQLILEEFLTRFDRDQIVVATSEVPSDDIIQSFAESAGVRYSRGSEEDVLRRVSDAVRADDVKWVVRVCADNPFMRADSITQIIEPSQQEDWDYASFALPDGTPTILSHLGLFAEAVNKSTLITIDKSAESKRHREHLTSHILDFPEQYRRNLIPVPEYISDLKFLRLTVDTGTDFEVCQQLYQEVVQQHSARFTTKQLISVIQANPHFHSKMADEIAANQKR